MPFVGRAEAIIDAKQRLALPAKFRARWNPAELGPTWFCVPWKPDGTLRLYPEANFNRLYAADQQDARLIQPAALSRQQTALFGATEQLDVDASHRVRLHAWQIELIGLGREVLVTGAGDRLEVRNRDASGADFTKSLDDLWASAETVQPPAGG